VTSLSCALSAVKLSGGRAPPIGAACVGAARMAPYPETTATIGRPTRSESRGIDAARFTGARHLEIRLGAERQPHVVHPRRGNETREQRALVVVVGIPPGEAVASRRGVEIAYRLAIGLNEGDDDLVDDAGEHPREAREIRRVPIGRRQTRQHDRIVAPNHDARTKAAGERAHLAQRRGRRERADLERARIVGEGELDVERRDAADAVPVTHHRCRIPGPEDEAVDRVRPQRDDGWPAAIGTAHAGFAGGQAGHQPAGIEGGNIGPIAGRNDHRKTVGPGDFRSLRPLSPGPFRPIY
jgi:hypothetical protein